MKRAKFKNNEAFYFEFCILKFTFYFKEGL